MATRQEVIDSARRNSKLNAMFLVGGVQTKIFGMRDLASEFAASHADNVARAELEKQLREEIDGKLAEHGEFRMSNEEWDDLTWRLPRVPDEGVGKEFALDQLLDAFKDLSDLLWPANPDWDRDYDGIPDGIDIDPDTNHWYRDAMNWFPRQDPLTLDLNGDGIKTLPADGQVLFDHNGDGIKEGTGWIAPTDGILVLDRNGNGTIDSGRELFGDNTIKNNGQRAAHGFDALSDLDSNADGKIDNTDAQWSQLKIWKDANSDGISQANELFALSSVNGTGIKQINLANTAGNINVGNGNVATANGTFVWNDGHTGAAESTASNLDLAANPFYREFTDSIPIPENKLDLVDMQGSGAVRDLREAAVQSSELEAVLRQYMAATTRDEQMALLDKLLEEWAQSSTLMDDWVDRLESADVWIQGELMIDRSLRVTYSGEPNLIYGGDALRVGRFSDDSKLEALAKVRVLEIFNRQMFFNFPFAAHNITEESYEEFYDSLGEESAFSIGSLSYRLPAFLDQIENFVDMYGEYDWSIGTNLFTLQQQQIDLINQSYAHLRDSVYQGLLLQTRLKPYLDQIQLAFDEENGFILDFSSMDAMLETKKTADVKNAYADLIDLVLVAGTQLTASGWGGAVLLGNWLNAAEGDSVIQSILDEMKTSSSSASDLLVGTVGNEMLLGNGGADIVIAGAGNDDLRGNDDSDALYAGGGNDSLYGGNGDDILDGGTGNDFVEGDAGNDVYVFRKGSGADIVQMYDTTAGRIDTIKFDDVNVSDVTSLKRSGNDLIIYYGTSDSITVQNYYYNTPYTFTQIQFADGTTYTPAQFFEAAAFKFTDAAETVSLSDASETVYLAGGNDAIYSYAGDDVVHGELGNDTLSGNDGNDRLYGGEGLDTLYGGNGNDALDGGVGNDFLQGDVGNDVYVFRKGSGADIVQMYDTTAGRIDTIKFDDVNISDVTSLKRSGNDLIIYYGTSDSITIQNYYYNTPYTFTQIQFADGTTYTPAQLFGAVAFKFTDAAENISLSSASETVYAAGGNDVVYTYAGDDVVHGELGNDTLSGNDGNDRLYGGEGLDTLYGGNGNDVLDGGVGNDFLQGDAGNDTYMFRKGSGVDVVQMYDTAAGRIDTIKFDDVNVSDVTSLKRSGNDLIIYYGTSDSITVQNYYYNTPYTFTQIQFADGSTYTPAQFFEAVAFKFADTTDIVSLSDASETVYLGGGNDAIYSYAGDDVVHGELGNDTLSGNDGNDRLYGGEGLDTLYGGNGNDVLDGGVGNDFLQGDVGNDIYVFRRGSGVDVVQAYDSTAGRIETIKFTDVNLADITSLKKVGNDLIINYGAGDSVTIKTHFSPQYAINQIELADGSIFTPEQLFALLPFQYGDSDDSVNMSDAVEVVRMGGGNDTLSAVGGNDQLYGEAGNDTLYGGNGNDVLDGGVGNDLLQGDAGNDTYKIGRSSGQDTVSNYDNIAGTVDQVQFGVDIAIDQLWFRRVGSNLEVSIIGTSDSVTISNWYSGAAYHTEQLKTIDGKTLLSTQVENLVSAMASFVPPSAGQTTLPQDYQNSLNSVIAANWS